MPDSTINSNHSIKYTLVFFIFVLPIYLKAPVNLQWPLVGFFISLPFALEALKKNPNFFIAICLYCLFAILQYFIAPIIDSNAFIRKFIAILLFILTYNLFYTYYDKRYDKYIISSLIIVIFYGIYSSMSYILGYHQYLIPGTCGTNNISPIGHLRCSTFGEGNYLGGYIAILILIYPNKTKQLILCLIGGLISWSPTPIILFVYTLYKFWISNINISRNLLLSFKIIIILAVILVLLFIIKPYILDIFSNSSERSSLRERAEFIRSGIAMWLDYPLIGVGFGNYGFLLPEYSIFQHLIDRTLSENARFIANNNIAEFLSEQGLIGLSFYAYMLFKVTKISHPVFNRFQLIIILIFIGFTMPTFFQIIIAALLGILTSKYKNTKI